MRRKTLILVAVVVMLAITVVPALAVQFGQPDGNAHPQVGLLVFEEVIDGERVAAWRCSGTMLSETVMLTAGHCTFGATEGRVWFEADVDAGRPANGYPFGTGTSIEFSAIHTHPDYVDNLFFLHDAGIVILSAPGPGPYAELSPVGLLDQIAKKRGQQDQSFTVVGYGLQSVVPTVQRDLVRYQGQVKLISVNGVFGIPKGTSASFTNSPGKGHGSGGTCFGDSGGPVFYGSSLEIAAVTSFGVNANCAGTGGAYRVDTVDDQAWINSFLP